MLQHFASQIKENAHKKEEEKCVYVYNFFKNKFEYSYFLMRKFAFALCIAGCQ